MGTNFGAVLDSRNVVEHVIEEYGLSPSVGPLHISNDMRFEFIERVADVRAWRRAFSNRNSAEVAASRCATVQFTSSLHTSGLAAGASSCVIQL